jgi:hypothetical protein
LTLDAAGVRAYSQRSPAKNAVVYREAAMKRIVGLAAALLVTGAVGATLAAQKPKTMLAQGKVTAVTNDSLTVVQGSDTMTFTVDSTTKVVGKGVGTKANQMKAKNEPFTITDGVAMDDIVKVTYHEMDGKMHAAQVTIVQKNMKSQVTKQ